MSVAYDEWLPGPGLRGVVAAYWRVRGDPAGVPEPAILPDGHVEVALNRGAPVAIAGPAFTGDQPPRCVVGPLSRALRMAYRGSIDTLGIRLHPARGAAFLGHRAVALTDRLLPLAAVCPSLDRGLARVLEGGADPATAAGRAALDRALLERLAVAPPADRAVAAVVDRLAATDAAPLVAEIARDLGLSARQLQRRFLDAVGMTPKRFVRVVRFARTWQMATMRPPGTWAALALESGYADQAHMVREFRAFGAPPPTRLFAPDWYAATALERKTGPAEGVRSVQDPPGGGR